MFETMEQIAGVIVFACVFLSAVVGFIISFIKSIKNKKLAGIALTTNEIAELAKDKVIEVEKLYSRAAQVLKTMGVSTGAIKKENVMNYLESQCVEQGVAFNYDYWSEQVESLINVMNVNKE